MTSSYPAEFANGGGVERFVVRSGGKEFHGNAYEFLRNDKLDARGFYNASRSIHRENEFGFSAGGPILVPKVYNGRNRSFVFANVNWYKNRGGAQNSIASVPNDAFRSGIFPGLVDAKGSQIPIYDPATTASDSQGNFTRLPFPGNIIPAGRISKVSQNILAQVPTAKIQSLLNNYPASGNTQVNNHNWTIKADPDTFTSNHRLSGTWNDGTNRDNGPYAALLRISGAEFPRRQQHPKDGPPELRLDDESQATQLLPDGFQPTHQLLVAPETTVNWGDKLGISGINNGFPTVSYGPFTHWRETRTASSRSPTLSSMRTASRGRGQAQP